MIVLAALFGLLVRAGLRSTGPGVWPHVIIPPFALWLYATLATLVNVRKVVVSPKELVMSNGPVPVRPRIRIPRSDVACTYHCAITALNDDGDATIVFGHTCGVETRAGVNVQIFGVFKDMEAARDSAQRVADGFGEVDGARIMVRHRSNLTDDPADKRTFFVWVAIVAVAAVAGFLWDLKIRLSR